MARTSPFIQILHTGNSHGICVSSLGRVDDGTVKLYDSLFHNVIGKKKLRNTLLIWLVNLTTLVYKSFQISNKTIAAIVGSLQQHLQHVWHYSTQLQAVQFDTPQMGPHLLKCLKSGMMELLCPTF